MIKDIREINFPKYATLSQATVNIADMGERSITTNIKIDGNIVPDFSFDWELEYKGERYIHTAREPQASKENTSIRTSIDLTFKHWAIVELQRYYFMEMASTEVGTAIADKYKASLGLSLPDFVNAFNKVLDYYFDGDIQIVLNPAWVASSEASFIEINYSYLWDVLQKVYEIYGVRWTLEPVTGETRKYLIKFGYAAPEASHTFEYGYKGGLLKVERQVQSADIKNILLGRGGDKNLPYLYFKDYDKYGAGTSEDASGSSETKTIEGVTAPAVPSLAKYGKAIVKAKYTGTFEIPEGKSGVLMASVPTATGYYINNNAPTYIPEFGKFLWNKNEEVEVVFISLGSPNIQVYDKETDEQVSQVAIPSGKYYYTWENEVTNNYTDTLHDIVVTLPNLTLITGSGSVIGASLTGNRGFRPDPDAIPELKDIAFTELRSSEFREYIQGWKAAHYNGEIPPEQSEAFIKGLTDEKFNPIEYVKDDDSVAKYGEQWGALDNNEEIYPSIQGSGIDDIIDVEQIQTDAVDNSDLFAFTEEIEIPQRATGLVIEPFSTVEYSFYINGSDKFQYDDYKNSVSLSSYELEAKDLSNQQNVGADSFEVIEKEIQVLTTAFDWGKIRVTLNITNNSDKRVSVVKFLGRLKVYYSLNGTTDEVGNALWATEFPDYAPTKTGSQSKLTRSATLYCYGSNTKRAIIHIPDGYVGILPKCTLGDTKIRRDDNVSTENLVYEVKFKNAVFIDTTNENNTYDFAGENSIPAGDYYIKYTYEYSVTNVPNNKSWALSQGISLSLTLKAEHPELLKSPYTFDIWVKNLWNTEKREDETDKQYAERVWFPIIGQNDAEITFTSGLLAISSDYQFKIAKGGINYDTSKEHNGDQSHWRLTLQKSDAEYEATGLYIPNTRINAKSGDKFFFTNIELPHQYILWAEKKLHDYKVDNLEQVSDIKPTWAVSLDKVRCNNAEEGDVKKLIDQIQVGATVKISHPFITDAPYNTLYVQSATYTYNEPSEGNPCIYPDVDVVLSDKVVTVTNPVSLMQGEIDALRQLVGGSLSNIEQVVRAVGDRIYLRKDGVNDVEAGYVQFQRGARFDGQTDFKDDVIIGKNGYAEGLTGFGIRLGRDGGGEMDSLILRKFLEVPELRYNRVDITLGNAWRAVCAGIVENVIPDTDTNGNQLDSGVIYLKLESGEVGSVAVDDICMGIFHNETDLTDNAITDSDDSKGNFTFAGFTTVYFRVTEILEESNNSAFRYVLRAADDTWTQKYHPQVGMTFSGYGNLTNKERQTSKYETRTYERYLKDVDTWTFSARNVAAQFGDLSNLGTLLGVDMTGYSIYLNNIYMTGRIQQLNSQGEEVPVITDRGVWSSSETYYKNDDVYHNNAKWRCLVDDTTSEPTKNSSAWLLLEEALKGDNGTSVTILSQNVTYQVGTSGTTAPTGTWSANIPTVQEGQYLWTRTIVNYSDGKSTTSYSVSYQGKNGTTARNYILEPSTLAMKRGQDNALTPTTVTFSSFYQDGNSTTRTAYAGRFVIAESTDGNTFTNKYTSLVNESSKVYTPSATNVTAVRCTLYAADGTSKMLDIQTTVILTDVSNVRFGDRNLLLNSKTVTVTAAASENFRYVEFLLPIKVSTGDVFTFRVDNITNLAGNPTSYSIVFFNAGVTKRYSEYTLAVAGKEYQLTINVADLDNVEANFLIYAGPAAATAGNSVQFDQLMLVKGNKMPTEWQAAPEDINSAITNAENTALSAAQQAQQTADRLTDWASDNFISPQEKTALKQQQKDIQSEYQEIIKQANQYSISTIVFTTAFQAANAALTKYTATLPENIPIESDYANIADYYNARQNILDNIVTATKAAVDSAPSLIVTLSNEYQGIPSDSNGIISDFPTCKTIVSVFFGTTDVSSSTTYNVTPNGLTGSWDATTRTYTVTALSADAGYVDIKATYKDLSTTKRFNVAKAKAGEDGSSYSENLVLKSNEPISTNGYYMKTYQLSEPLIIGDIYTFTIWGNLAQDRTSFGIWDSHGNINTGFATKVSEGVYSVITDIKNNFDPLNAVNIYNYPVGAGTSTIEKFKIEKGANPHPVWTPNSAEMIGKDGVNGCILRTSQWALGAEYHNDTDSKEQGVKYLDVVVINDDNGNQYRFQCKQTHTSDESNKPPTNLVGNDYWSPLSNMAPLYTPLLLADNAEIAFVNGTRILIKDTDGNVCAGMMADDTLKDTPFWLGADYENRNNAPFRMNSKGQGVANDLTLNGSYKGSTGYWDGTNGDDVFLGDSKGLGRKDNIVIPLNNQSADKTISASNFSWGAENVGRIIRLFNYKWNNQVAEGKTIVKAPSDKYFYENGQAYNQIIISREMIELVGYGIPPKTYPDNWLGTFYGWIVSRRVDLGTNYVYGSTNKIVAAGTIMRDNSKNLTIINLWSYRMFNIQTENWTLYDENPNVKVVFPTGLVSGKRYTVTLQATLVPPEPNISDVSINISSCALSAILVEQTDTSFTYRPIRGTTSASPHCVYFEIHSTADLISPTAINTASIDNQPMAVNMAVEHVTIEQGITEQGIINQETVSQESEPIEYILKREEGIG